MLVVDEALAATYARSSERMTADYQGDSLARQRTLPGKLKRLLFHDYRTRASIDDLAAVFEGLAESALCLSIGGGPDAARTLCSSTSTSAPSRTSTSSPTAHRLPYADGSVNAIYCEAVLEHLADPPRAVSEMFRVLTAGGRVFACSPFIFGYPRVPTPLSGSFSLTGHQHLFTAGGFQVASSGVCVGPVYTMVNLTGAFIHELRPRPRCAGRSRRACGRQSDRRTRPLDRIDLNAREKCARPGLDHLYSWRSRARDPAWNRGEHGSLRPPHGPGPP